MNVRLTKARAFELDPAKAYLLFVKSSVVSPEQAKEVRDQLSAIGINNVVVVLTEKNSYKLVEATAAESKLKKQAVAKVKQEAKKAK